MRLKIPQLFYVLMALCCVLCFNQNLLAKTRAHYFRASYLEDRLVKDQRDWTSYFLASGATGSTREGYNGSRNKVDVLSIYGPVNVNALASGVEGITPECTPCTYSFFVDPGIQVDCDELLEMKGKTQVSELELVYQQNLAWGFYGKAYLPLRWIKYSDVRLEPTPTIDCKGTREFCETGFLCAMDGILREWGINPLPQNYEVNGLGDLCLSLGWHGYCNDNVLCGYIDDIVGALEASVIVPTGHKQNLSDILDIPLGYNGHLGFSGRGQVEFGLWSYLALGFYFGVDTFQSNNEFKRVQTNNDQSGLIILQTAFVDENPGSIWGGGFYAKVTPCYGISFSGGISFFLQEDDYLQSKDDCLLASVVEEQNEYPVVCGPKVDDIINATDQRLKKWTMPSLHVAAYFNVAELCDFMIAPKLGFFYNAPFSGQRVWDVDMIGGEGGITARWCF